MYIIAILVIVYCITRIVFLFYKDYKARSQFIDFLRSENDRETLKQIGAMDENGQECYRRISYFSYQAYILKKYESTNKKEFLIYHECMMRSRKVFLLVLLIIISLIVMEYTR